MNDQSIPPILIDKLIRAGNSENPSQALYQELSSVEQVRFAPLMRIYLTPWKQVGNTLSERELSSLIRAITVAEESFSGWGAGSVSPAIWLFRIYREKFALLADNLADWMLAHSGNGWLPSGSQNYGAKSIEEYYRRHRDYEEQKRDRAKAEKRRETEAGRRRAEAATIKLFGAVKRNDIKAVTALISQGADPLEAGPDGTSALDYAKSLNRDAIIRVFIRDNKCDEPI